MNARVIAAVIGFSSVLLIVFGLMRLRTVGPELSVQGGFTPMSSAVAAENNVTSRTSTNVETNKSEFNERNLEQDNSSKANQTNTTDYASELMKLAMKDDSNSLHLILEQLRSSEPSIRRAALQAVIQFGSRDAIPSLIDAAEATENAEDKAQIANAIEFLRLPSLSEVMPQGSASIAPSSRP